MLETRIQVDKEILYYFRFMQIFGYCPVSITLKKQRKLPHKNKAQTKTRSKAQGTNKIFCINFYVQFCLGFFYGTLMIYENSMDLGDGRFAGRFLDLINFVTLIIIYFVICLESYLKRRSLFAFLQLHERFREKNSTVEGEFGYKRFCQIQLLVLVIYLVGLVIYGLIVLKGPVVTWSFFVGYLPANYWVAIRTVQIMGLIELLGIEVDSLRKRVKSLKTNCSLGDIQDLTDDYNKLFAMSEHMKQATFLSLLCIYLQTCLKLITSLYWVCSESYNQTTSSECSFVLTNTFFLYMFLRVCVDFERKRDYLIDSVYSIPNDLVVWDKILRVNCLILQTKHQHIVMDGNNFFVLDLKLFTLLIGSYTTYILFYFQLLIQGK